MENNVLGIKIFRNVSGLTELFQYNSSSLLEKGCEDNVREIYACVPDTQKNLPLILLTGMQEGYFITVLKYKKVERPDDSTSAWIYVPANIKITGKELASIVESVNQVLTSDRIDQQRLTELFSRKYEMSSTGKTCFKSAGSEYAYRFFGPNAEYSLSEILNDLNQPVYKNYKRVILLDNALGQKLTTGHNVSNQRILERCVIAAPEPVDGFKPYYRDIPFNKPLMATEMDKFTIVWKKDGYKPIEKSYVASKDCVCTAPLRSEMKVLIPYSSIVVWGNGRVLSDYTLIVNKALVHKGENIEISVDAASNTQISVSAEGFNEYKNVHDLTSRRLEIKLANRAYTYDFSVYSSSQNDKVEFTCSFRTALRTSPLDGYDMIRSKKDPKKVYLEYCMFTKKVIIILFSLSLLFLAGGAAGGWFMSKSYYEADETTAAPATPATPEKQEEPETPTKPEKKENLETPTNPEKPAKTEKTTTPGTTSGQPTKDDKNNGEPDPREWE